MDKLSDLVDAPRQVAEAKQHLAAAVGGPTHLQVLIMLAAVLGLVDADLATVSAVADQLKSAFHISNTQIGLLLSILAYATAAGTLPLGLLADRVTRTRILTVAAALWALLMMVSGFAFSYGYLLVSCALLGLVTAAAWPCVASLSGDFFAPRERAGAFGLIVAGEFIGAGVGFVVSGEVSSLLGWRAAFFVMALPAAALALAVRRYLPEPQRGSQGWLATHEPDTDAEVAARRRSSRSRMRNLLGSSARSSALRQKVAVRSELLLRQDPRARSLWWTLAYLLRVPSYRLLVIASALAYYFLSGVRAFTMIYFRTQWHVARSTLAGTVMIIGIGAIAGVVTGGRVAERLLRKGHLNARIHVPAAALLGSIPPLALSFWVSNAWLGVPLATLGAGLLSAAIAPIDAARLDIVPPGLWGRAEAGRMVLRSSLDGSAPLLFGIVAAALGGGNAGLRRTLLLMLIPMLAAGGIVSPAGRNYARDVATAAASVEATRSRGR